MPQGSVMTIIFGLAALSILVVVHEIGHFLAARLSGVTVESFSVGMGPVLLHRTVGGTDFRLSLVPFGGYCGLKGEQEFRAALDEKRDRFERDPSSMYGSGPARRLFIAVAGPFFNLLFAFLAFTAVALVGYTYYSADNRIILADEIYPDAVSRAREQGLRTGDRILSLDAVPMRTFSDIQLFVSSHADEDVAAVVERGGEVLGLTLRPAFEKSSGSGKIGVVGWIDPVVAEVPKGGAAERAGLRKGDTITAVDGVPASSAAEVFRLLAARGAGRTEIAYLRDGEGRTAAADVSDGDPIFSFEAPKHRSQTYTFFPALARGVSETAAMTGLAVKSIGYLFKGADVTKTVSGPVRITVLLGDTVKNGFAAGIGTGAAGLLGTLAIVSISLFIMNLLPVPVLDGGIVLFSLAEMVLRKPLKPKFLYYTQFVGIAFIAALAALAVFSDARYLLFGRK
jgi:regulator of sigma E protease